MKDVDKCLEDRGREEIVWGQGESIEFMDCTIDYLQHINTYLHLSTEEVS